MSSIMPKVTQHSQHSLGQNPTPDFKSRALSLMLQSLVLVLSNLVLHTGVFSSW